jgi:phenylpyruvate tautomerase PptA (4-oxalocrotonate tautomerase family)
MLIYDTDELPHLKQVLPRRVRDVYKDKENFRNISVRAANRTSEVQQGADENFDQRKRLYKPIDECMPPRVRIRLFIYCISLTFGQRVSRDEMDELIAGVSQLFESIARQSPSVVRVADSIEVQQKNTSS